MKIFGVLVLRCFVSIVAQIKPLCPATTERVWPDAGCPLGRLNPEEAQGTEPATCRGTAQRCVFQPHAAGAAGDAFLLLGAEPSSQR